MRTNSPAGGSEERHRDKSALRRVQALGYLALLLAVPLAATGIAMGRAGVPAPFSTACGVVSCAAGGQAP